MTTVIDSCPRPVRATGTRNRRVGRAIRPRRARGGLLFENEMARGCEWGHRWLGEKGRPRATGLVLQSATADVS